MRTARPFDIVGEKIRILIDKRIGTGPGRNDHIIILGKCTDHALGDVSVYGLVRGVVETKGWSDNRARVRTDADDACVELQARVHPARAEGVFGLAHESPRGKGLYREHDRVILYVSYCSVIYTVPRVF